MSEFQDLERLLRLKRYEQPPEGYYEDFAERFKDRQRAEMLNLSARGLLVERVSTWLWGFGPRRLMVAGGAASALLVAGYYFVPEFRENDADSGGSSSLFPVEQGEVRSDQKITTTAIPYTESANARR